MARTGHIVNTQFIIEFQRNAQIRKRVFDFEEKLVEHFKPFQINNIPDDADSSFARLEAQSVHGFSHLKIFQNRLTLLTNYNDDYKSDVSLVKEYFSEKKGLLIDTISPEKILFAAIIVEIVMHMPESEINSYLKENTKAAPLDQDTIDFTILYSKKYEESFYLNVACSKITEQNVILKNNALVPTGEIKKGINAIVDVNSRPSIPLESESFDNSIFDQIEDLVFEIIGEKTFDDYLKGSL